MFFNRKKDKDSAWREIQKEYRESPRMTIKTFCKVANFGQETYCKLVDLSLSGAAFICPWELKTEESISLYLEPPRDHLGPLVNVPGAVGSRVTVRTSTRINTGFRIGVHFDNPPLQFTAVVKAWFMYFGEEPRFKDHPEA